MKTYKKIYMTLSLPLFLLAGCSTAGDTTSPHFGNAVRQNIAVQIVNPDAPETDEALEYNGARAALAQHRYVTDKVEKTNATTTSSVKGSGDSGGK